MTTPACPRCRRVIAAEEINVANDVAYCRLCNLAHSLSELTHRAELEAGVDFSRQALSDPPPLASDAAGADAWPPARVATMPPPDLSFAYPPHNRLFVDGYRIGLGWIADHPGAELRRAAGKLGRFTRGTTLGLTGWNLPLGASGIRHPVDLTLAELGPLAIAWTTLLLAGALAGAVAARDKRRDLLAWLLWPATQLIVTVAFFGYGRLGAMAIPVLCLLLALAIDRVLLDVDAAEVVSRARGEREMHVGAPVRRVDDELATRELCVEVAAFLRRPQQRGLEALVGRVAQLRVRFHARDLDHARRLIEGTARSMGIEVTD